MTRYQWYVLIIAWLGWVFDIMDTALFNLTKVRMLTDLMGAEAYKLRGPAVEGEIQTLFIIGWAIGGLLFGILADRWGRARTLVVTILIYCLLTGLTALCQTVEQVMAIRFFTAIGIGGEWAAGAALIAEVVPNRARAGAAAILQTAAAVGPILAALANWGLAAESWRWMFVVGVLPAALVVAIRYGVKEPERWKEVAAGHARASFWEPVRALFAVALWRKHVIIAMIIGLVGIAGAGNISFWMPNLVAQANAGASAELIAQRTSFVTFAQHGGTILGVLLFPMLCDRMGRRNALGLFFVLSMGALLVALYGGTSTYESLLWKAPLLNFFMIGLTAGFGLYFPELFPTRLRATGVSFAYNVARIGQAPLPWATGLLIGWAGGNSAFGVLVAGAIYVLGLIALPFAPETKGKPLPEDDAVPA